MLVRTESQALLTRDNGSREQEEDGVQALLGRVDDARDEEEVGFVAISSGGRNYQNQGYRGQGKVPTLPQEAALPTTRAPAKIAEASRSFVAKLRETELDRDAVHFGVRMSVCITVACLFILLRSPGEALHQAVWIVVTVQFVCWFPTLDAASVVEKSIQRLYGTFVGAASGLAIGFTSLAILNFGVRRDADGGAPASSYNVRAQSAFLILPCFSIRS